MALVGVELEKLGNGARRADHSTTSNAPTSDDLPYSKLSV